MDELHQKLIDNLRGTTNTLQSEAELLGLDPDDPGLCLDIDNEIFECAVCGWWCDISEESSEEHGLDDLTCGDCCE